MGWLHEPSPYLLLRRMLLLLRGLLLRDHLRRPLHAVGRHVDDALVHAAVAEVVVGGGERIVVGDVDGGGAVHVVAVAAAAAGLLWFRAAVDFWNRVAIQIRPKICLKICPKIAPKRFLISGQFFSRPQTFLELQLRF